jgi:two-component system, OmpR family, phosphate regulon response regulator PhoB
MRGGTEPQRSVPAHVLVAEDDLDIRELLVRKLTLSGYQVTAVSDGLQARKAIAEHRPDVVLLDVTMPGMSGLDVVEELRSHPDTAELPVILLTARSQEFDISTGFALGATDYVVKPFSPRDLVERVARVLAGS